MSKQTTEARVFSSRAAESLLTHSNSVESVQDVILKYKRLQRCAPRKQAISLNPLCSAIYLIGIRDAIQKQDNTILSASFLDYICRYYKTTIAPTYVKGVSRFTDYLDILDYFGLSAPDAYLRDRVNKGQDALEREGLSDRINIKWLASIAEGLHVYFDDLDLMHSDLQEAIYYIKDMLLGGVQDLKAEQLNITPMSSVSNMFMVNLSFDELEQATRSPEAIAFIDALIENVLVCEKEFANGISDPASDEEELEDDEDESVDEDRPFNINTCHSALNFVATLEEEPETDFIRNSIVAVYAQTYPAIETDFEETYLSILNTKITGDFENPTEEDASYILTREVVDVLSNLEADTIEGIIDAYMLSVESGVLSGKVEYSGISSVAKRIVDEMIGVHEFEVITSVRIDAMGDYLAEQLNAEDEISNPMQFILNQTVLDAVIAECPDFNKLEREETDAIAEFVVVGSIDSIDEDAIDHLVANAVEALKFVKGEDLNDDEDYEDEVEDEVEDDEVEVEDEDDEVEILQADLPVPFLDFPATRKLLQAMESTEFSYLNRALLESYAHEVNESFEEVESYVFCDVVSEYLALFTNVSSKVFTDQDAVNAIENMLRTLMAGVYTELKPLRKVYRVFYKRFDVDSKFKGDDSTALINHLHEVFLSKVMENILDVELDAYSENDDEYTSELLVELNKYSIRYESRNIAKSILDGKPVDRIDFISTASVSVAESIVAKVSTLHENAIEYLDGSHGKDIISRFLAGVLSDKAAMEKLGKIIESKLEKEQRNIMKHSKVKSANIPVEIRKQSSEVVAKINPTQLPINATYFVSAMDICSQLNDFNIWLDENFRKSLHLDIVNALEESGIQVLVQADLRGLFVHPYAPQIDFNNYTTLDLSHVETPVVEAALACSDTPEVEYREDAEVPVITTSNLHDITKYGGEIEEAEEAEEAGDLNYALPAKETTPDFGRMNHLNIIDRLVKDKKIERSEASSYQIKNIADLRAEAVAFYN